MIHQLNFPTLLGTQPTIPQRKKYFIHINQHLQYRKNIPYFEYNDLEANIHYHSLQILKTRDVVLLIPLHVHVLVTSGVYDRMEKLLL